MLEHLVAHLDLDGFVCVSADSVCLVCQNIDSEIKVNMCVGEYIDIALLFHILILSCNCLL